MFSVPGVEFYIDGGVRRGTDVVKALCLGARGVATGRPFVYALQYGTEGVRHAIQSEPFLSRFLHLIHRSITASAACSSSSFADGMCSFSSVALVCAFFSSHPRRDRNDDAPDRSYED